MSQPFLHRWRLSRRLSFRPGLCHVPPWLGAGWADPTPGLASQVTPRGAHIVGVGGSCGGAGRCSQAVGGSPAYGSW
eukprot:12899144-Prorocentrum_lima.AAC.1